MEWLKLFISPLIDLVKLIAKKVKKPDPAIVLKRREELRKDFENNLPVENEYGVRGEAIIRDINRMDTYPDIENKKGISPWFKVEVKGLYHKGVEFFINFPEYIKKDEEGHWQFTDDDDQDEKVLAYPVGRIPYDLIQYVDWDGDEFYNFPHIFCRFKEFKGQPYESIPFYARHNERSHYLYEIPEFRPWDKKSGFWFFKKKKNGK
ncbi:MAG: hypothetical protein WC495_04560 [Patescibacteria group bacterium]|jgi:hypothetical protein